MYNKESAIAWYQAKKGKVTYSMLSRKGPNSYDCSSAVYYALIAAGVFPVGIYIGNTDSLFGDLERYGWQQITPNAQGNYDTHRGDVFIWGIRGQSGGANGHTGMFVNDNDVIHCNAFTPGISVNNYDQLAGWNGNPTQTFYRFVGGGFTPSNPSEPVDQVINPGSYIAFPKPFVVNEVQDFGGLWQFRSDELCPVGFSWADNAIPAEPVYEVDGDGWLTNDQELNVGSRIVIPGRFQILDVGASDGRWLGQVSWNGFKFWVDLEPITEIGPLDGGTPIPGIRPITTTTTEVPNATTTTTTESAPTTTTTTETTTVTTTQPITTTTTTILAPAPTTTTSTTIVDGPTAWEKIVAFIKWLLKQFEDEEKRK